LLPVAEALKLFSALARILRLEASEREGDDEVYANAINVRTLVMAAAVAIVVALGGAGIASLRGSP
jgi:preprotein translocase subunit SecY